MKKVDPNVGTTLAKRYIPSTENLHQESNEAGYEPITAYIKDGAGDRRAGNTYELQAKEQDAAKQKKQKKKSIKESNDAGYEPITAYIKDGDGDRRAHELQANEQDAAKQKKQKKKSNKDSGKNVIEDESGYVVPDTLWEEKQRPVAPGSAASAQTPGKTSKNTIPAPETVTKVEYDVPEGIEHRDTSKVKGQREPQSERQAPTSNLDQKEHVQQAPTGKDHRKQKLQAKEPSKITSQPEQSQNNESAAVQGGKPAKKNKPILHQKKENSSKLALQYQSNTSASSFGKSGAAATSTAAPQAHNAVKSKLQNLLTPAVSSQPTKPIHAKLSKQPSTSAKESAKVQQQQQQQEPQQTSKVMAMAQKLQGVGQASTTAGPETTDSKTSGAKKKYVLHACMHVAVHT